ncbi:MAG: CoA transferase [Dehalococcoidales bacterium]|nr:CoA transferase [Dehalococcoidales bacterium]
MRNFPLDGIRVVDFCQTWLGPHMCQWLAVMGAEVIKIESNAWWDSARRANPYVSGKFDPERVDNPNRGTNFAVLNYSKKSCTLNLKKPEAVELAKSIIRVSDVVVDNYAVGVMDRLGLGYSVLKEIKPDIIVVSANAVGNKGPLSDIPGYAPVMDSWGGLVSITGYRDSWPDHSASGGWTDIATGQYGAFAILIALRHRLKTGEGQSIDLSMMESVASRIPAAIMDYIMNSRVRKNDGNRDENMAPHNCYPCRGEDKWVAIAVSTREEWLALCQAMGNPEWCRDEKFADELSRWQNQDELDRLIGEWTRNYSHYEVMEILQKAGVMAGASLDVEEAAKDPHLRERGFFIEIDQPEMGKIWPALPWKQTDTLSGNYQPAPLLGQHNDYVFGELLGMPKDEIARMVEKQVIF